MNWISEVHSGFMNTITKEDRPLKDGIELLVGEEPIYERMKQFYKKADASGVVHARDAIRCGATLIEEREFLQRCNDRDIQQGTRVSHVEPDSDFARAHTLRHGRNTPPEATLASRMRAIGIPEKRGRRWMIAAENIFFRVFGLIRGIPSQLEHHSKQVSLSEALTLADDRSDSPALDFQRAVFAVLENHSLRDAIAGAFYNESSDIADTRAINGAVLGDGGRFYDNRRDYPHFTLQKLEHLNTFFGHWDTMPESQRTEIKMEFAAAISGDKFKLRGRLPDHLEAPCYDTDFQPWPDDVCDVVLEAIKLRRKKK